MGLPDVFSIDFNWAVGLGFCFTWHHSDYGRTLDIGIMLPCTYIGIFCRKTKENKWI